MYVISLSNSCFLLLTSLFKYSWKDLFYFCNSACMEFWKYQAIQLWDAFFKLSRWDMLLRLASGFVWVSPKVSYAGLNYCLSTNSHWAYLSCNLEFSVMQMRLDIGLLTKYLSVHFEHCWMEIRKLFLNCTSSTVLFVGSGDKYFRLSRNLEE